MRNGKIEEYNLDEGEGMAARVLHESHNSGEVWGLASDGVNVYTTADDN